MTNNLEILPPRPCELIIYTSPNYIEKFQSLFNRKIYFIHQLSQKLNLTVFIIAAIYTLILGEKFILNYFKVLSFFVRPKVILTTFDNYDFFYLLKDKIKNEKIKFCSVQNNWYGSETLMSHFNKKMKYKCDHLFIFGEAYRKFYKRYIQNFDEIDIIGSFRSNFSKKKITKDLNKDRVNYISQFRFNHPAINIQVKIVKFLDKYAYQNNLKLFLYCKYNSNIGMSKTLDRKLKEKEFFNKLNLKSKFKLVYSDYINGNFEKLMDQSLVVTNDSTLGYELFGRGKKVAFFTIRRSKRYNVTFGWPAKYSHGKFWTNNFSETKFKNILDWMRKIKKEEWLRYSKKIRKNLISSDIGNLILKKKIDNLIKKEKQND